MTNIKATKRSSAIIKRIMAEIPNEQRLKNQKKVEIACLIYDTIKERGYSSVQFAHKMGKHQSEISKWISGTHNFTIDTLMDISIHLGVDLADLIKPKEVKERIIFKDLYHISSESLVFETFSQLGTSSFDKPASHYRRIGLQQHLSAYKLMASSNSSRFMVTDAKTDSKKLLKSK